MSEQLDQSATSAHENRKDVKISASDCRRYKCDKNEIPITVAAGSTTPLVDKPVNDEEAGDYDPFEHRKLLHPTTDLDTLIHLLKGSLGSGILAMPLAFLNSGLLFGVISTFIIGFICTYCVHILVVEFYTGEHWKIQVFMGILAPLLVLLNLVRNLKWLAPFSMLANLLIATSLGITFYYVFSDLPSITNSGLPNFSSMAQLPLYFGTVIFALEGIGVVMPLENNMKTPTHFIGCPGVLNIGMAVVVTLYTTVGFFGYLKYGSDTMGSITLNLPPQEKLAQSVKLMIAVAIFFTYGLQFYVPMEIIWKSMKHLFGSHKLAAEYSVRIVLVLATVAVAAAIPNLGPFISLVGAVCLSTLGLMFPSIIEIVTYWENPGLGRLNWRLWKNILIIMFGILGFVTGTYSSINDIIKEHNKQ
ncbi:Proton-coupled amino acid transporter-like protein pathetic [Gryllus bimaculatus]|nr:Proton-coupled amino acid transporter-like protein pathetic [Gryllus bimaculatus]